MDDLELNSLSLRNRNIEKPPRIFKQTHHMDDRKTNSKHSEAEEELEELRHLQDIEREQDEIQREYERNELERKLKELDRKRILKQKENEVRRKSSTKSRGSALFLSEVSSYEKTTDWVRMHEREQNDLQINGRPDEHDLRRPENNFEPTQSESYPQTDQRIEPIPKVTRSAAANVSQNLESIQSTSQEIEPTDDNSRELNLKTLFSRQLLTKELPSFDGNPLDWPHFMLEFKRTSALCCFSEDENLVRLRNVLRGKAKECVQALLLLPGSLNSVLNRLENKFGRPELIIYHVTQKLESVMEQMGVTSVHNIENLADSLENLVNTIELVGKAEYMFNPILLNQMTSKLNGLLKLQWGEYVSQFGNRTIDLKTFSSWLRQKSDALLLVENKEVMYLKQTAGSYNNFKKYNEQKPNTVYEKCLLCKQNHTIIQCKTFREKSVSERIKWALGEGVCFLCLKKGHTSSQCKVREGCKKCGKRHNIVLHLQNKINSETNNLIKSENKEKVLLRILPVKLHGPKGNIETFAFLDDGSTVTLIEEEISEQLGLNGPVSELVMQWSNEVSRTEENSKTVSLNISGAEENARKYYLNHARTVKKLSLPVQSLNLEELSGKWKHLEKVNLPSFTHAKPTILIGQDNWPLLISKNVIHGPWRGPAVSKTCLGWVVHGNVFDKKEAKGSSSTDSQQVFHHWEVVREDDVTIFQEPRDCCKELRELVGKAFGDNLNNDTNLKETYCEEDQKAERIFEMTTKKVGERWETGLIWKENADLPNNYIMAKQRLQSLEKRMDRDKSFGDKYVNKMEEYIFKGYASKRTPEEAEKSLVADKVWFLPHLGIINTKKPNKFRICFDAAAKFKGICLNDNLMKGPDLFIDIVGLLFRFRQYKIAMTADIKEMFPQIIIRSEDQLSQQFLWRGFEREKEPEVYIMRRMIFGAACSPFSAQKVKNKNALEYVESKTDACNAILRDHYMDDYVGSCSTEEKAKNLIEDIIHIHTNGGFVICGWTSNNKEVLDNVPIELRNQKHEDEESVLGMTWKPDEDVLICQTKTILNGKLWDLAKLPTKRDECFSILQKLCFLIILSRWKDVVYSMFTIL